MLEYVLVGIAFLCAVGILLFYYTKMNIDGNAGFYSCRNPNCVRCVQYQQVMIRAYERYQQLSKIHKENTDSTGRIHKSLHRNIVHSSGSSEQLLNHYSEPNPLVFDLKELNLNDLYDPFTTDQFTDDVRVLQDNKDKICSDFHRINKPQFQHLWLKNDTPFGQWSVFHLINQGKTVVDNIKHCEKTFEIISGLQNIMKRNVFGNVVFSVINPGTVISTHYGPTNIRIRCHLGLITVDECTLTVSGKQRKWKEGECLLFNDAFPHGVTHAGKEGDSPRCVLIVDLWHPDISLKERNSIDYIFSPVNR